MLDQLSFFTEPGEPLKNYPGRKGAAGQWQKIISNIPKCELFIEAMAGSGFISSLVKNSGCQVITNDLNRTVIDKIAYTAATVTFTRLHYQNLLKRFDNGSEHRIFYFDPPYLMDTRSYKKPIYKHEWNDQDHKEFLQAVTAMKCRAMISHYPHPMYDEALSKWRVIQYNTMTRAGVRAENLYMNFKQPVLLQCPQVVGENFTDRQRIKRKVERLIKRLDNEPPQERAAILSSIIDKFSYVTGK